MTDLSRQSERSSLGALAGTLLRCFQQVFPSLIEKSKLQSPRCLSQSGQLNSHEGLMLIRVEQCGHKDRSDSRAATLARVDGNAGLSDDSSSLHGGWVRFSRI